jgi:hypothetical protein
MVTATLEDIWHFPRELKIPLLYHPVILLLGIYPKELAKNMYTYSSFPMFTHAGNNKDDLQ